MYKRISTKENSQPRIHKVGTRTSKFNLNKTRTLPCYLPHRVFSVWYRFKPYRRKWNQDRNSHSSQSLDLEIHAGTNFWVLHCLPLKEVCGLLNRKTRDRYADEICPLKFAPQFLPALHEWRLGTKLKGSQILLTSILGFLCYCISLF